MRILKNALLIVFALSTTACEREVVLSVASMPAPNKTGIIDEDEDTIIISKGTALAVACSEHCDGDFDVEGWVGPCRNPPTLGDDVTVGLYNIYGGYWPTPPSVSIGPGTLVVLAGKQIGTATLRVHTDCVDREFRVVVVE